jgi:hypothetical protein
VEAKLAAAIQHQSAKVFLHNAAGILETAESVWRSGQGGEDWTLLIGHDGALRMIASSDWPLDSLQAHLGAPMAFRVRQQTHKVLLEGRAGTRTCLFESAKPDGAARLLLAQPAFS